MTTQDLIDYYTELLIMQYATQPNAKATMAAFIKQVVNNQIIAQVGAGFDITTDIGPTSLTAIGAQLDMIAAYRGAQRVIYGLNVTRPFFLMPVYGDSSADTDMGFALYGETPINWYWITYEDALRPIDNLTDDELYRLIQFRARSQSDFQSVGELDTLLFDFFGDNVAVFEGPMTLLYIDLISDPDTLFTVVSTTNSLPRPAGVSLQVFRSETLEPFFGYQIYGAALNEQFVGFGIYGTPLTGSFVRYG